MKTREEFSDPHGWAQQALPWQINRTLNEADSQRLREHLLSCAECRRDYEIEQRLAERLAAAPVVDYAPQASLTKLMQRIDQAPEPAAPVDRQAPIARPSRRSPLAFAFVAQAASVAVLAVALSWLALRTPTSSPVEYRTLSTTVPSRQPHLQVVFADRLTTAEQRALLQRVQGHIIDGPSSAGLFLVAIDSPDGQTTAALDTAAAQLRGMPGVRFVAVPPPPVMPPVRP